MYIDIFQYLEDMKAKKVKSFLLANVPYDLPDEPVKT